MTLRREWIAGALLLCIAGSAFADDDKRTFVDRRTGFLRGEVEVTLGTRLDDLKLKPPAVVATVTGVGNDPYGLALVEIKDD